MYKSRSSMPVHTTKEGTFSRHKKKDQKLLDNSFTLRILAQRRRERDHPVSTPNFYPFYNNLTVSIH